MSKTYNIPTTDILHQADLFSTFIGKYGKRDLLDEAKTMQEKWIKAGEKSLYGIAMYKNRYLVAMKPKYGEVGDKITIVLDDKKEIKIKAIIAEILADVDDKRKNSKWSEWGRVKLNGKFSVVTWETTSAIVTTFLTQFGKKRVKKVVNESQKDNDTSITGAGEKVVKSSGRVFVPSDGRVSPSRDDKWYHGNNNYPFNSSAPRGGGNCTWYAYGRFCEIANKWIECSKTGNAVHFYDKSYFPTCKRGKEPKLGAIVCWAKTDGYEPGHVAVVEKIYKNGDIGITNSGWSGGWMGYMRVTKASGYVYVKESNVYGGGWSWPYTFRGFIYNPIEFDSSGIAVGADTGDNTMSSIDMRKRIEQLYTSENYGWVVKDPEKEENDKDKTAETRKTLLELVEKRVKAEAEKRNQPFMQLISDDVIKTVEKKLFETQELKLYRPVNSIFDISKGLVESPFIKIKIGGEEIGSYGGSLDKFPNYINSLNVEKTNGEINEYSIEVVHQIRVGEDPNQLDKVFAKNGFNKIIITYGDSSSGGTFRDTEAIITNVSMNRDYASARITYNISATSACNYVTSHIMNFPARTDKPSNIIRDLLYNSEVSNELKAAFPAMASRTEVNSKGLIPTNDCVVSFNPIKNTDPVTYINYLVSSMSNVLDQNKTIKRSSYFIFYTDDAENGAGFEIREISREEASNKYNSIYEVTVGYPDNNNIFSFNLTQDRNWSIMYNKNTNTGLNEYVYTIMDNGDVEKTYSPNLNSASRALTEYEKNWWTFMTQFPVSANLTIRGLLRPAFLTNYIKINVVFYGQKHIASGLYAIVGQQDSLGSGGFRTNLSLIRVGDE